MFGHVDVDGDVARAIELLHGARQRGHDRRHVDQVPMTVERAASRARSSWRAT